MESGCNDRPEQKLHVLNSLARIDSQEMFFIRDLFFSCVGSRFSLCSVFVVEQYIAKLFAASAQKIDLAQDRCCGDNMDKGLR